ncbi:MAG: hypothetical protein ACI86H_001171 [bacterium]|jgi:hypothetical protein
MKQPLRSTKAKKLLREIIDAGIVTYSQPHALDRLKERLISMPDCLNVMRAGVVQEAELDNEAWRHRVSTNKIVVVVEFLSEDEVLVVTAWRL